MKHSQNLLQSAKHIPQNDEGGIMGRKRLTVNVLQNQQDSRQPLTKEQMEKHRRNVFERLKKRTLRGKIINLIDENMYFRCNHLLEHQKKMKNLHENGMYYKTLFFKEKLQDENFKKKPMVFSKPQSNDFYLMSKIVSKVDEIELNQVFDRYDPQFTNEDEETMMAFKKICQRLTKEELLEVGEDPNYFIVKQNHRQRYQLLNPKLWDDVAGLKYQLDNEEQDTKKDVLEFQPTKIVHFKSERILQSLDKSSSKKRIQPQVDPIQKKNEFIEQLRVYLIEKHRERQERFEQKALVEEQNKLDKKYDIEQKYTEKIVRAENTINEIKDAVQRQKIENQKKEKQQMMLIEKNRLKQKEDDEIFLLNTHLRRMLIEHQVDENKNKVINQKLSKVKTLQKYQTGKLASLVSQQ
ncbi:hypothetical protein ABPG72_010640 [Tetrahymena utriculariae]